MKIIKITDEKGEVLKTKEGVELTNCTFEAGDEFIPKFNKIVTKTRKVKGKDNKIITINNYKLLCKVRNSNKELILNDGSSDIFVSLTPAQFNTLNKKLLDNVEINQRLFSAYNYEIVDEETGDKSTYIGVGFKSDFKESKSFDDFEANEFEDKE